MKAQRQEDNSSCYGCQHMQEERSGFYQAITKVSSKPGAEEESSPNKDTFLKTDHGEEWEIPP